MAKIDNMKEKVANNMVSSMLIHPGEMIKDEIVARGLTQKDLAKQMGGCSWHGCKYLARVTGRL